MTYIFVIQELWTTTNIYIGTTNDVYIRHIETFFLYYKVVGKDKFLQFKLKFIREMLDETIKVTIVYHIPALGRLPPDNTRFRKEFDTNKKMCYLRKVWKTQRKQIPVQKLRQ